MRTDEDANSSAVLERQSCFIEIDAFRSDLIKIQRNGLLNAHGAQGR
jgi:hypothetical protein